jgi:hypothetical protein
MLNGISLKKWTINSGSSELPDPFFVKNNDDGNLVPVTEYFLLQNQYCLIYSRYIIRCYMITATFPVFSK